MEHAPCAMHDRSGALPRGYSGSGRSWVSWHSVQAHVRSTALV